MQFVLEGGQSVLGGVKGNQFVLGGCPGCSWRGYTEQVCTGRKLNVYGEG